MLFSPCLKKREKHITAIAKGKRGFIDPFTLTVMGKLLQCISMWKNSSPDFFSVVHLSSVGFDLAAFNPSG